MTDNEVVKELRLLAFVIAVGFYWGWSWAFWFVVLRAALDFAMKLLEIYAEARRIREQQAHERQMQVEQERRKREGFYPKQSSM